jgi:hypothetical protein
VVFLLLFAIPLVIALVAEYSVCRFPKRRVWRWCLPLLTAAATVGMALYRYHGWSAGGEKAPIEQLLFIPGLPALGALLGLWLGWGLWKKLWLPRVVTERKKEG